MDFSVRDYRSLSFCLTIKTIIMTRAVNLAIALSITLSSCNGQSKKVENKTMIDSVAPQTNIVVNKEYDQDGNLIRYDSTYSYYYSNIEGDTILGDSILSNFKSHFNEKYFFSDQPYFKNFFFDDSLMWYDFYKKDFFYNRFRNNMERMNSLFREMDSIKNKYFIEQFDIEEE